MNKELRMPVGNTLCRLFFQENSSWNWSVLPTRNVLNCSTDRTSLSFVSSGIRKCRRISCLSGLNRIPNGFVRILRTLKKRGAFHRGTQSEELCTKERGGHRGAFDFNYRQSACLMCSILEHVLNWNIKEVSNK